MAVLQLLAAAAGAQVVAAHVDIRVIALGLAVGGHLATVVDGSRASLDDRTGLHLCLLAQHRVAVVAIDIGGAGEVCTLERRVLLVLHGVRGGLDLDAQDGAQVILVHGVDEHLEGTISLGLVLDQRVALTKAAQSDTGLEVVHLLQVVHPAGIDDAQHDLGVELAHEVLTQALGLHVVALLDVGQDIGSQGLKVLVGELGRIDMPGELHDPLAQALEIALAIVAVLGAELLHAAVHGVVHDLGDVVGQILAVQNLVALGVDDLALLVHDVIVLEDALAHGEVDALDLVLGALDGLGDDLVLDGHVVAHVGRDHHLGDAVHLVATEQAHEVVSPGSP